MLIDIWGADIDEMPELMERVWRFRHQHFVERMGWEAIRRQDGREIDQFDTEAAIHLPLMLGDEVVGYTRLLPTTRPHLLSDIYPQLMAGADWPRGDRIYEWTRCTAEPGNKTIGGVPISNILMTGVLEYCLMLGLDSVIVQTHPKLVQLLLSTGWDVRPLAAPTMLDGQPIVPIEARPSARALLRHHELYAITGSVVDLARGARNPLDPNKELTRLPYLDCSHGEEPIQRLAGE